MSLETVEPWQYLILESMPTNHGPRIDWEGQDGSHPVWPRGKTRTIYKVEGGGGCILAISKFLLMKHHSQWVIMDNG